MANYPQGTKGTTLLLLSAIGNYLTVLFNGVQFAVLLLMGKTAFGNLRPEEYQMMHMREKDLGAFGMRNVVGVAGFVIFLSILASFVLATYCLAHWKSTDGMGFIIIGSFICFVLTMVGFFLSFHWPILFQAAIWILAFIGGILGRKPKPIYMPNQPMYGNPTYFDPGIQRPR